MDVDAELSDITNRLRLADDDMSLVLVNGKVIGHRQLKRYYDQKIKPDDVCIFYWIGPLRVFTLFPYRPETRC